MVANVACTLHKTIDEIMEMSYDQCELIEEATIRMLARNASITNIPNEISMFTIVYGPNDKCVRNLENNLNKKIKHGLKEEREDANL